MTARAFSFAVQEKDDRGQQQSETETVHGVP
jgi:hypothetical protein